MRDTRNTRYPVGADAVQIPNTNIVMKAPTETGLCQTLDSLQRGITVVKFDASKKSHRRAYKIFKQSKRWPDNIRFEPEWPFNDVVSTVESKLVDYALRNIEV